MASDGQAIPGNALDHAGREARVTRIFRPYHDRIAAVIAAAPPAMILSLHSFTPQIASDPDQQRPGEVGVLYNADDRLAGRSEEQRVGKGRVSTGMTRSSA